MSKEILLAIDPGDVESAFCFMDMETYEPLYFAKEKNEDARIHMAEYVKQNNVKHIACEMIQSYGSNVGRSVFFTCVEIGRLTEFFEKKGCHVDYIYRKDEKIALCGTMQATDASVRQALIDRFAKFDFKNGKGTKYNHDWFWGFKSDMWAAYCVGCVWLDAKRGTYTLATT